MIKGLFILTFFLFLSLNVFAVELNGKFDINANCLVPTQLNWELLNTDSINQTYSISAEGQFASWINLNGKWIEKEEAVVTVYPSTSKTVYAFVKPDTCNLQEGKYLFDILVKNSETVRKTVSIFVNQTSSIDLNVSTAAAQIGQCGENSFNVFAKNSGKTGELISLEIAGIPGSWIDFDASQLFLEKNASQNVSFKISVPCDAEIKNYDVQVIARIAGTTVFSAKTIQLSVEGVQKTSVILPKIVSCSENDSIEKITVKNDGNFDDSVKLSLEGPNFIKLDEKNAIVKAGESKQLDLNVFKTEDLGKKDYSIKAYSSRFDSTISTKETIEVVDCFNAEIENVSIPTESCVKDSAVFKFNALSKGTKSVTADIDANGVNASVFPKQLVLDENFKKSFTATVDLSNESVGAKQFNLSVKSDYFTIDKNFSLNALDCYNLVIDSNAFTESLKIEAGKSAAKIIRIKNIGTKNQNVSIRTNAPNWVYVEPKNLSVDSNKSIETYLYLAPIKDSDDKNYSIELAFDSNRLSIEKTVQFEVFGGINSSLAKPNFSISSEKISFEEKSGKKTVKTSFKIKNNGILPIKIQEISSKKFDANFSFDSNKTIDANSSIDANATISIDSNAGNKIIVPLQIKTSNGLIQQNLEIDLAKGSGFIAGFAVLADWRVMLVLGVIAAIILIGILLIAKNEKKKDETEKSSESAAATPMWNYSNAKTEETESAQSQSEEQKKKNISKKSNGKSKKSK